MIAIICTSLIAILAPRDSLEKTLLPLDHELLHVNMAHLPRYYHKAAALMGVPQSCESVFFFSILRSRWAGHHAESLWTHLNLEFLTFNFIFWWNFASKNKGHPTCTYATFDANQSFHVIQPHATLTVVFFHVVSFLWAIWSFIFLLILFLGTVVTKTFLDKHKN